MRPKNRALWPSSASEAMRCCRRQASTSSETQSPPLEAVRDSARRRIAARHLRACSSIARSARSSWSRSISRSDTAAEKHAGSPCAWQGISHQTGTSVVPVAGAVAFEEVAQEAAVLEVAQDLEGEVG